MDDRERQLRLAAVLEGLRFMADKPAALAELQEMSRARTMGQALAFEPMMTGRGAVNQGLLHLYEPPPAFGKEK